MARARSDRRRPRQPIFVLLLLLAAVAMLVPAGFAFASEDIRTGQIFLSCAVLFALGTAILMLALRGHTPSESAFSQLSALFGAFTVLPVVFAVPVWIAATDGTISAAWFEMISSFTTTGATLWAPGELQPAIHLWRALVGWLGGLLVWVSAMAILAPLSLGGFEVRASRTDASLDSRFTQVSYTAGPYDRLARYIELLAPVYGALTFVLTILLVLAGNDGFTAFCEAMAVMATSGISPSGGPPAAAGGLIGEVAILLFLGLALSRRVYSATLPGETLPRLLADREFSLGLGIIGMATVVIFLGHWYAGEGLVGRIVETAQAFWGGLFTVTSFLTTAGFESRYWQAAADWSGLETPGLVLLGLAIFGGGIGTTAGGVKLLRVYALYKHGLREVERLIHPSSVGGSGQEARRIRSGGALIAWVFFMLFALSIAAFLLLLTFTGMPFEDAIVLTIAALTNCGPLATIAAETPIAFSDVSDPALTILAAAMVIGRIELLAIIALLNPEFWRK